jgi:hypothetical protein
VKFQMLLLVAAAVVTCPAQANVYKCRNAAGAIIYSQEPCEKEGAKQEKKLTPQQLKTNEMRMRPSGTDGGGGKPSFSQGSNYQGTPAERAEAERKAANRARD